MLTALGLSAGDEVVVEMIPNRGKIQISKHYPFVFIPKAKAKSNQ